MDDRIFWDEVLIVCGLPALAFALFSREFRWGRFGTGRRMPLWLGRSMNFAVAVLLIGAGAYRLLTGR